MHSLCVSRNYIANWSTAKCCARSVASYMYMYRYLVLCTMVSDVSTVQLYYGTVVLFLSDF